MKVRKVNKTTYGRVSCEAAGGKRFQKEMLEEKAERKGRTDTKNILNDKMQKGFIIIKLLFKDR